VCFLDNFTPFAKRNLILSTDSYKASHWLQYSEGTTELFSYIEARKGFEGFQSVMFAGLQPTILEYLLQPITQADVQEAKELFVAHGEPFNEAGWMRIVNKHAGLLPIKIRAVPEGTVVPVGNVLLTVESLDPELPWVGSYIETLLLRGIWYATTVATRSYQAKLIIKAALEKSFDSLGSLPFKLHDFGARGVSSGDLTEWIIYEL